MMLNDLYTEKTTQVWDTLKSMNVDHDFHALILKSALANQFGEHSLAKECKFSAARNFPLVQVKPHESGQPLVLKTLGIDQADISLKHSLHSGEYYCTIENGHFDLDPVINSSPLNWVSTLFTSENNWQGIDTSQINLVVNTIADPDLERGSLLSLSNFLTNNGIDQVINHPERVLKTGRQEIAETLAHIPGVIIPKIWKLKAEADNQGSLIYEILERFKFPFILRSKGEHNGKNMFKVEDISSLRNALSVLIGDEAFAIQFIETADDHGIYRKYRVAFIDGEIFPAHIYCSNDWNVHASNSIPLMLKTLKFCDEANEYILAFETFIAPFREQLDAINRTVGLNYVGLDFAILDDQLLIFEVNASMKMSFDLTSKIPVFTNAADQMLDAFSTMVDQRARKCYEDQGYASAKIL